MWLAMDEPGAEDRVRGVERVVAVENLTSLLGEVERLWVEEQG